MLEVYWGCLIFGVIFALATILFADVLGHFLDSVLLTFSLDHLAWLQPLVIVGGMTIFGGSGVLLTRNTNLTGNEIIIISLLVATVTSILLYFSYILPMRSSENSSGFFMKELIGKAGEVVVPVPADGYGEVLIKIGAGNTNQIAMSYDKATFPAGTRVIVTNVKDGILYVSVYQEQNKGGTV